jgi:antitoxin ParD1/3/4
MRRPTAPKTVERSVRVPRVSISLPDSLARFVENYRRKHGLKSRSQVFEKSIKLLRSRELEAAYRAAARVCTFTAEQITVIVIPNEAGRSWRSRVRDRREAIL